MDNFKVELTVTRERVSDLLTSAFEGGSDYWYCVAKKIAPTTWEFTSEPTPTRGHYRQDYPLNPGGSLLICDIDDEEKTQITLDWAALQRGLTVMQKKYPEHFADFLSENDDAITGDVFLQCCLYNEIIFS